MTCTGAGFAKGQNGETVANDDVLTMESEKAIPDG